MSSQERDQEDGVVRSSSLDQTRSFKDLFENIEDILWVAGSGGIHYVSPSYEKIWGVVCETLYSDPKSFMRAVHPDDQERVRAAFERERQEGTFDEEYRITRGDGSLRWIRARSFPVLKGDTLVGTVGIAQDVTARKILEERLEHENAFGKAVIEHAADGICVCQEVEEPPHIHFTVWNPRMTEITGYRISEINQLGWYQTLYPDPDIQARARRRMEEMRLGKDLSEEEWTIIRKDGAERIVSISTSVFSIKDGVPRVLAVLHDVTERTHAEQELRSTHSALQDKHRELAEANIALKVLLRKRDEDREELRHSILTNLRYMVMPHIEKIRGASASEDLIPHYCDLIERNINEMASSFIWELSNRYLNLTPSEMRTAELLKKGKSTKEIAQEMGVAPSTINTHREGLRRKLGITGKKTNLSTFLRTLK